MLALGMQMMVSCKATAPKLEVNVQVVDADGQVIEAANVALAGVIGSKPNLGGGFAQNVYDKTSKLTDATGRATVSVHSLSTEYGLDVKKDGYYEVTVAKPRIKPVSGKWEVSENLVEVVLKKKKNPIPMHKKRFEGYFVELNKPMSIDLLVGDWVAPHGEGKVADLTFTVQKPDSAKYDFDATLLVEMNGGELDALIEFPEDTTHSAFKGPYEVHDGNWMPSFNWVNEIVQDERGINVQSIDFQQDRLWGLRLRTMADEQGNLIQANYGKMSDIEFYGSVKSKRKGVSFIRFTYYYNPTVNDRNVEFDSSKNLYIEKPRGLRKP